MSFDVGVATFESATPQGRHRIATSVGPMHAYLFDLWDNPPAWFEVPATDLQPKIARALVDAAEAGAANITAMVQRCVAGFDALKSGSASLYAGAGAIGAFATFPTPERIEIGWMSNARVYRIGEEEVQLLTRDHDLRRAYLDAVPDLTTEQLEEVPDGIILRAIGMGIDSDPKLNEPEVVHCQLAIGEELVLVPKGIDETILMNPRLRRAPTAEAAAKLIVELASAKEPDVCTGAIVVRRTNAVTKRPMVRDLIAKCPDPVTENVLADWCEENQRVELVPWLRSGNVDVRACAVNHLAATLAPGVTAAAWRSAASLARALGMTQWTALADRVASIDDEVQPCPKCGRSAIVVAGTEIYALCIHALHIEQLAASELTVAR